MTHLGRISAKTDPEQALIEFLIAGTHVDPAAIDRMLRVSTESGEGLTTLLTRLGVIGERELATALGTFLDLPVASAGDYPDEPIFPDLFSAAFLERGRVMPIRDDGSELTIAAVDPLNDLAISAIRQRSSKHLRIAIAVPAEFEHALERLYRGSDRASAIPSLPGTEPADVPEADIERLRDLATEAPIIRLVGQLINRAVETRASDIHIEPSESSLRIRFRIDGALKTHAELTLAQHPAIVSRVKIMARLNIAERRLPQDGRAKAVVRGREVDLRIGSLPTMYGESVAIRILDQGAVALEFNQLGFAPEPLDEFLSVLDRPHGVVLVTGPTGSGKTTTLYTSLTRLNSIERKIITVEDPVEYRLPGISQIQVNPKIGYSFATALRSILRQDPDVIMVGEIRDAETAQIAVQAALTGHLVLATLHTNTAAAAFTRLLDMGVDDYLVASTVNGVVAQRLVRKLCASCRVPAARLPRLHGDRNAADHAVALDSAFSAVGCPQCNHTGYRGRTSVVEVLSVSDQIRDAVLNRTDTAGLQRLAASEGMTTMHADGLRKVGRGETTYEEVLRVTREV